MAGTTRKSQLKLIDQLKLRNEFGARALEVGVQEGAFSTAALEKIPNLYLYMVDAWRFFEAQVDIANVSDENHEVKLLSALQNTKPFQNRRCIINEVSIRAATIFPDEFFDWIYLDAAHDKENVLKDLGAWWPKVKKGGVMCGDDYFDGKNGDAEFGVVSATTDFFKEVKVNTIEQVGEYSQWWAIK